MDDLKERLRAGSITPEATHTMTEAADHIEALEAELIEQARSNGKGVEREAKLKADLAVAREALEKVCAVRVCRESDNIWAGSDRCKKIALQALKELDND